MSSQVLYHPSVTQIPEATLVEQLLASPYRRDDLLAIRGIPAGALSQQRVSQTGLPGSPEGDVDILLWKPDRLDQAVAIEVKTVKATLDGIGGDHLNRLAEFKKGVRQANDLERIGFWKIYLWVFVLVDSRLQNGGRITYDGLGGELKHEVENTISIEKLHPRVGLIHYEFVQSMDEIPLEVGSYGGHLIRLAESSEQPVGVTGWVAQRDRESNAEHAAAGDSRGTATELGRVRT